MGDSSRGPEGPGPVTGRQPAAMHGGNARFDEEVVETRRGANRGSRGCSDELISFNNAAIGWRLHPEDPRGLAL